MGSIQTGKVGFALREGSIALASDIGPLMVIAEKDNVFTRIAATETGYDDIRIFDLSAVDPLSTIHMERVGDVNLSGTVNSADSLAIGYSRLSTSNPNYAALTNFQRVIADINNSGTVNSADALLIDYSRLSKSNVNYRALDW